jgi:hypothetical protein
VEVFDCLGGGEGYFVIGYYQYIYSFVEARALSGRSCTRLMCLDRSAFTHHVVSSCQVSEKYKMLLQSENYVTRRMSLKMLGELLVERSNFTVM